VSRERFLTVFLADLRHHATRPLVWVLLVLLALTSFGLSSGNMAIQSGDSTVGGDSKAWITSEFTIATMFPLVAFLTYVFFVAVAAGMIIPRDDELKVGALLHATRLTPAEYIWGKFTAVLVVFLGVLAAHLLFQGICNHLWPHAEAEKIRGPFHLVNYLRPATFLALPTIVFFCGMSFAVGERTRSPILVFVAPTAAFLVSIFFLFSWAPTWLDPRVNRLLMWIEPSGFRWITETWLKLDRGVDFYNVTPVGYDLPFLASRLAYAALGFGLVALSARRLAATVRGTRAERRTKSVAEGVAVVPSRSPLARLAMSSRPPGFLRTALDVARFEAANLRSQPGLYIFVPIILVQTIGTNLIQVGAFGTPVLLTPGFAAVGQMNTLTLLVCVLLLFYTVESVLRERHAGLAQIYWSTPSRTAAVLLGKALANGIVGAVILVAAMIGSYLVIVTHHERWIALLSTWPPVAAALALLFAAGGLLRALRAGRGAPAALGTALKHGALGLLASAPAAIVVTMVSGVADFSFVPFALVWGLLLLPTLLLWATFVTTVLAITGNRYLTYAVGLAVFAFTGWKQTKGEVTWLGNWDLWGVLTWTDFGSVQPNELPLFLNRLFWLAVMAFLLVLTVRVFPRREHDSAAIVDRFRLQFLGRTLLRLSPVAVPAIVLGLALHAKVSQGHQGSAAEKRAQDYWGRNVATWKEAETPQIGGVDLDVELEPRKRWFRVNGTYDLVNWTEEPMGRFPMSVGDHFENLEWTLAGERFEPENRAKLCLFELPAPIAPGDTLRLGFSHEGRFPHGMTKNGGGMWNFVLPAGVVLTSFNTGFVPVPFFEDERGVDEDNQTEPKDYPPDFYEGRTPPALGSGVRFPVRTRITGPAEYQYHGVGVMTEETVEDGRRTVVWRSDFPVNFFNIVAAKWDVWEGEGATVYYHPDHRYNVDAIGETLVEARRHYSQWFHPYPWKELRLNEFPALANYAQGFPTNITFSENIGFLTRATKEADAPFLITAHESAHQWWGNLLMPGKGPGGNILSEGMAHFSTVLLFDAVKGEQGRIEFCKRIEENYGDARSVDTEKPLVRTMGDKKSDTTVMYDKGGWVFWMLHRLMGEEASLAGIRDFIGRYQGGPDYPVLQDFVRVMREHAPDPAAFDAFVDQWFFDVVVPEYSIGPARLEATAGGWLLTATVENRGTGRMPVEVCAFRGKRFEEDGGWRDARAVVELGAGESAEVEIACDFEPEKITVDPDATVLMLAREKAERDL